MVEAVEEAVVGAVPWQNVHFVSDVLFAES